MNAIQNGQKRKFFRLSLDPPLIARMIIITINGKSLETGTAEVLIDDIAAGGLRFLSNLSLPVDSRVVLQFETEVLGQQVKVYGHTIRCSEIMDGIKQYGFLVTMDEEKHAELAALVNKLSIRLRKRVPNGNFYLGDKLQFFKNMQKPSAES
ncbi:PilZ domain-containing protein [Brevibacillus fulvus]|uniref:PilZ domain-containing protein n=1 Tax=Brevibacillus fulvus TaxID=1125967 RepID=A0A939BP77_9BACL|nr:hypothetical protein [Brevibacillus fulvus]